MDSPSVMKTLSNQIAPPCHKIGRVTALVAFVVVMSHTGRASGWQRPVSPPARQLQAPSDVRSATVGGNSAAPAVPALTVEEVTSRAEAAAATDLDEDIKKSIADSYRLAVESLQQAQSASEQLKQFQLRSDPDHLATVVREVEQKLTQLGDSEAALPDASELSEFEQALAVRVAQLAQLKQEQTAADSQAASVAARRKELREQQLPALNAQLQEITKQLEATPPADENAALTLAKKTALTARRQALQQQIPAIEQELAAHKAEESVDLIRLQRELAAARVDFVERERELLDARVKALVAAETAEALRKARLELINSHPLLKPMAERNASLAEEARSVATNMETLDQSITSLQALAETLQTSYSQVTERVKIIGETDAVGFLLRKERANLPDVSTYRRNLQTHQDEISSTHFSLLSYEDELKTVEGVDSVMNRILTESTREQRPLTDKQKVELEAAVESMLERRHEYLNTLKHAYSRYFDRLLELVAAEKQILDTVQEYSTFIDERVLWIRSDELLEPVAAARESVAGIREFFVSDHWRRVITAVVSDVSEHRVIYLISLIAIGLLFRMERKLPGELRESGELARRPSCTNSLLTWRAMLLTLGLAIFWPGIAYAVGWRIGHLASEDPALLNLGQTIRTVAGIAFPLELLRNLCRPSGLAEHHLDWPQNACLQLRRHLRWVVAILMPLLFLGLMLPSDEAAGANGLSRLVFIVGMALLAVQFRRILRPLGGVLHEYIAYHQNEWVDRFQKLWYVCTIAAPVALAGLSLTGFDYTARHLGWRLLATSWLILGLIVVNGLLVRMLLIRRRKLSFEIARERRAAALAAATQQAVSTDSTPDSPEPIPVAAPQEEQTDLARVSVQSRQVVAAAVATLFVTGVWLIWSDVLPALKALDSWTVWSIEVVEVNDSGQSVPTEVPVSVGNVLLAALLTGLFFVAAKNIPGLMEIALLERMPLDRSARYAVKMLASYVIVLVGMITVFGTVGIGWSQVQWLATALTFGLAFGLQEVFANFVAGIIILFERPLRVGDVVTIDDVTGVVTQIRIRATTITNWDRKEFVVPNKEFITGKLLNWTLSDQINRIVITTGVAYGADEKLVSKLILEAATEHPLIMDDPSPSVTFSEFGDSALTFVLRAYLPNMDNRLSTTHDLHAAIYQSLNEHDIEIAFPQQDIHIRSMPESFTQK